MSSISPDTSLGYAGPSAAHAPVLNYPEADDPIMWGLRRSAWVKIGILTALFIAIFWPNLRRLWGKTNPFTGDPNWGHGIIVPLIGLYYLYVNRDELLRATVKPAWEGLIALLAGLTVSMLGIYWRNDFIWDFGMVVTLFGTVLLLCGWQVMKVAWFPILFLLCALPWPGLVYSWVASPLQALAAKVAVKVLQFTGVEAAVQGTKILMAKPDGSIRPLNVAEACAGMRSLMTFITIGGAVAFLSSRPFWQKVIVTLSAIPIAVFCNMARVSGMGLIDYYWREDLAEGFAHSFIGLVMLVPAFFMILMVGWILDHLFIEEVDESTRQAAVAAKAAKAAGGVIAIPRAATVAAAATAPAPKAAAAKPVAATPVPALKPAPAATPAPTGAAPVAPSAPKGNKLPPRPGIVTTRPVPPVRRPPQQGAPQAQQQQDSRRES